jgi:hypothetical protein
MDTIDFMKRIVRTRFSSRCCGWFNSMKNFRQSNGPGCGGRQVAPLRQRRKAARNQRTFPRTDRCRGIGFHDRKRRLDGFKPSSFWEDCPE